MLFASLPVFVGRFRTVLYSIALASFASPMLAAAAAAPMPQSDTTSAAAKPRVPERVYWQVEMLVEPAGMAIKKGQATLPIPTDWPEQYVTIHDETSSPGVAYEQVDLDEGVRALQVDIPATAVGDKVELTITFDVMLKPLSAPDRPQYFKKPEKDLGSLSRYLKSSPLIEPKSTAIKKLAEELIKETHNDWERIEKFYDWVLHNIELSSGKAIGAAKVLDAKKGCREDRVNLFIALCRNQRIPARTVWADRLEYAEFYLLDELGNGHWFPCQFSGEREFGSLAHPVVIEQKGDNFEIPTQKEPLRFVLEKAKISTVRPARGTEDKPTVSFMRRRVYDPELKK